MSCAIKLSSWRHDKMETVVCVSPRNVLNNSAKQMNEGKILVVNLIGVFSTVMFSCSYYVVVLAWHFKWTRSGLEDGGP